MTKIRKSQVEAVRKAVDALTRAYKIAERPGSCVSSKLNPSDMHALLYIMRNPGCIASDVACYLGVVPTTASTILDRLSKRGLVSRSRTEENRRIVKLAATAEGEKTAAALLAEQEGQCEEMLSRLDPCERDAFVALIGKVADLKL
ncbi:Transcriptional repressor MprA [Methyloligella halotolerans]|uniref:Transcriptional repressor MprA n=1 Tax=Methyloligella halotolerans TaxID=1177755 RepID=A0A1E2S171_9HYPH|nr:MarR family transcriptional regulator [Methyloligella halotolerans]ODA68088.1 Transcriptional repressor MprA [Methyloligella halotolerans]